MAGRIFRDGAAQNDRPSLVAADAFDAAAMSATSLRIAVTVPLSHVCRLGTSESARVVAELEEVSGLGSALGLIFEPVAVSKRGAMRAAMREIESEW